MIAVRKGKRIGLYASLDEALDRKSDHPVGTELRRLGDGELMAIYKNQGGIGA